MKCNGNVAKFEYFVCNMTELLWSFVNYLHIHNIYMLATLNLIALIKTPVITNYFHDFAFLLA